MYVTRILTLMHPSDSLPIRRALLSVSDKIGIADLARTLAENGVELISTGGTAAMLRESGLTIRAVSELTGFPEIMGGRVKTLHPKVHGALLARGEQDLDVCALHGIEPIDLLVINLYPFAQTVAKPDSNLQEAIENIDIGGPAMLRSAAKNHAHCCVVVDPSDYADIAEIVRTAEGISAEVRFELAVKAFLHVAAYDSDIADYLGHQLEPDHFFGQGIHLALQRQAMLRYGENPHQQAALYSFENPPPGSLTAATLHQGQELSYNNLLDTDAAWECVQAFEKPACVIVKHANPCGVAEADSIKAAYEGAYRTDPTSAFGGIIAFNRTVSGPLVQTIIERQFVEVLIAPSFRKNALQALTKKPKVRVLAAGTPQAGRQWPAVRSISGGLLGQTPDHALLDSKALRVVTRRSPTESEHQDLLFAWKVAKFVKSNAIVYGRDRCTVGVGAGQMSRIYSARIAAIKAADENLVLDGAVMASDAFFPFRDGIDTAHEAGITAVIQPGGSMRDDKVIAAADEHGMAMMFTGMRHFRH